MCIRDRFKRKLEAGTGSDFLYLHGFDQLESSVQAEAVRFLTAVLPELGAKYPLSLIHI